MQSAALIVVYLSATFTSAFAKGSINYCGSRMCGNTNDHTFCQYPEGPSLECVGYISAGLSNDEKSRVIARLNRRRNEVAAGRLRRLHSAGNMLKLRWVDELAREAQRWADQCRPPSVPEEHDACRDLYSISVGQCVASVVGEAPGLRVESMVDIWYMQNMLYKGNVTTYVPPSRNSSFYGDFAQIMWSESYMVGCGRSRFMTPWQGRLRSVERLVCNIAPRGPLLSRPIWSPSAPAALCPSRAKRDNHFNALCDIQLDSTKINEVDASMTLEEYLLLYTVLDLERNKSVNYPGSLDEIYLTRLAIATMENDYPTETYYNSIQRRDVPNTKLLQTGLIDRNTSTHIELVYEISTPPPSFRTTVKIKKRKRITFIGRPKPYNIDELTDLYHKTENNLQIEEVTKRNKEFYAEYDFVESSEENTISSYNNIIQSIEPVHLDNDINTDVIEFNTEYLRNYLQSNYKNSRTLNKQEISEINSSTDNANLMYVDGEIRKNDKNFDGGTENIFFKKNEKMGDYFTDPETVRELQDALNHMEVDLSAASSTEKQGKVRRELRELPGDDILNEKLEAGNEFLKNESEKNSSLDSSPMYNMVLKYMPYLRQYDGGLLSNANKATKMSSSFVIVLFIFYL